MKPIHTEEHKPDTTAKEETPKQTTPPIPASHDNLNRDQYHDTYAHYRDYKKPGAPLDP